jgi:hypothetical protein
LPWLKQQSQSLYILLPWIGTIENWKTKRTVHLMVHINTGEAEAPLCLQANTQLFMVHCGQREGATLQRQHGTATSAF